MQATWRQPRTHAETAVHSTHTDQETVINHVQNPVNAALTGDHEVIYVENLLIRLLSRYDRLGNIDYLQAASCH